MNHKLQNDTNMAQYSSSETNASPTPTFLSSSPTMFSADILADVVRGVPVKPSPDT